MKTTDFSEIIIKRYEKNPSEMMYLKTIIHNRKWTITKLSKDKYVQMSKSKWMNSIDDGGKWDFRKKKGNYIFIGTKDGKKNNYYIGQTTKGFSNRWGSSHKNESWVHTIIFIHGTDSHSDDSLSGDDVLFIEKLLIKEFQKQKLNTQNKNKGQTGVNHKEFELQEVVNDVLIPSLVILGVPGLKNLRSRDALKSKNKEIWLKNKGLSNKNSWNDNNVIDIFWPPKKLHANFDIEEQMISLKKGQIINVPIDLKHIKTITRIKELLKKWERTEIVDIIEVTKNNICYKILKDLPLQSASFATKLVIGKDTANGWPLWKDSRGRAISRYRY